MKNQGLGNNSPGDAGGKGNEDNFGQTAKQGRKKESKQIQAETKLKRECDDIPCLAEACDSSQSATDAETTDLKYDLFV